MSSETPKPTPQEFLAPHLDLVRRMAASAAQRFCLYGDEARAFVAAVEARLTDPDSSPLRSFRGDSRLKTSFAVLVVQELQTFLRDRFGPWTSSNAAKRQGRLACRLERLLYRDRLVLSEAFEKLHREDSIGISRIELESLAERLPPRIRRRFTSRSEQSPRLDLTGDQVPDPSQAPEGARLQAIFEQALADLPPEQCVVFRMHVRDGRQLSTVARRLGCRQAPLYDTLSKARQALREAFEQADIGPEEVQKFRAWDEAAPWLELWNETPQEELPEAPQEAPTLARSPVSPFARPVDYEDLAALLERCLAGTARERILAHLADHEEACDTVLLAGELLEDLDEAPPAPLFPGSGSPTTALQIPKTSWAGRIMTALVAGVAALALIFALQPEKEMDLTASDLLAQHSSGHAGVSDGLHELAELYPAANSVSLPLSETPQTLAPIDSFWLGVQTVALHAALRRDSGESPEAAAMHIPSRPIPTALEEGYKTLREKIESGSGGLLPESAELEARLDPTLAPFEGTFGKWISAAYLAAASQESDFFTRNRMRLRNYSVESSLSPNCRRLLDGIEAQTSHVPTPEEWRQVTTDLMTVIREVGHRPELEEG